MSVVEGPTKSLRQQWDPSTPRPMSTSSQHAALVQEAEAEYELLQQHEQVRKNDQFGSKKHPSVPTDIEDTSLLDELFFGPSADAAPPSPGSPSPAAVLFAAMPKIEMVELERAARRHVDQTVSLLATREQFCKQLGIDAQETIHPDTGHSCMEVSDAHRSYFGHPEDAALLAFLRALVKPIDDPEWLKVSEFADEETANDCMRIRHAEARRREANSPPGFDEDLDECTPVKRQLVQNFRHSHPGSAPRPSTATLASLIVPLNEVGGSSPRWVLDLASSVNPDSQSSPVAIRRQSSSSGLQKTSEDLQVNDSAMPPAGYYSSSETTLQSPGLATYPQSSSTTPLRPTKPLAALGSAPLTTGPVATEEQTSPRAATARPSNRLRSGREYRLAMRKTFLDRRDRGVTMTPDQLLTPQRPHSSRPASGMPLTHDGVQRLLETSPRGRYEETTL